MAEYIEREAAIKRFNFAVLDCLGMEPTIRAGDIIKALESIPAADVRPVVRGKWKKQDANFVWNDVGLYAAAYKCNRCGELNIAESNYCPNCGSDMRGGDA